MNLLAVTSDTWFVTCLGFCIVLILLCVFVFIMKGLGAIMARIAGEKPAKAETKTYAKDADGATRAAIAVSLDMAGKDDEMAAVAMALNLYYGVHDADPCRLTITARPTAWNSKCLLVNQ